ncbi:hypothetical protein ABC304_12255 [Microbacterium sp. 1P10UB]|uniref:hypothetical protein n=1 Tax=unclassified Microbacterium TaxID=2609290 RepID=UPI0039A0C8AD
MDAGLIATDDDAAERELEQLRRRAYGPAADIARDPDALRRLEALEQIVRTRAAERDVDDRAPVTRVAQPVGGPTPPRGTVATVAAADVPASPGATAGASSTVPAGAARAPGPGHVVSWWRRRSVWVAAVAGAAVEAAAVWGGMTLLAPQPAATLQAVSSTAEERLSAFDDGYAQSYGIEESDAQRFETYRGVTVWVAPTRTGGSCLVVTTDTVGTYGGACVPRGMEPMFDLMVYQGMVPEVVEGLPVGSVARFTYRDGTILVDEAIGSQFS